jgi:hypothetical protein
MWDWSVWVIVGGAVLGVFALFYFLVLKRQADDPMKRGEDSSMPPDVSP